MNVKHDGPAVRRIQIDAMRGGQVHSHEDLVVVEEPLEIRLARLSEPGLGRAISITMRLARLPVSSPSYAMLRARDSAPNARLPRTSKINNETIPAKGCTS